MATSSRTDTHDTRLILFGNAILDVGKRVPNDDLHRKYSLKLDDQLELDTKTLQAIEIDLRAVDGPLHVSSGGSCLNTCKVLGQLGERRTLFCGGIGVDENGTLLKRILDKSRIQWRLQKLKDHPTAICICLVHQESRCLLANIGASTYFNSIEVINDLISSAFPPSLLYIEGYFIPEKMAICRLIFQRFCGDLSPSSGTSKLVLNLNATYIVSQYPLDVVWLFHRAHLVFGNRREFDQLLSITETKSVAELLKKSRNAVEEGQSMDQTCIVTDGANSVQYIRILANNDATEEGCLAVPKTTVVDTTGAGDAFVAGFLYKYLKFTGEDVVSAASIEQCIRHGIEVASRKLRFLGCTIEEEEEDNLSTL